jgi:hypothetical protein
VNVHPATQTPYPASTEDVLNEPVGEQILSTALDLIFRFTDMLVKDPIEIEVRDERELPAAKETLVQCFALILMAETREEWRKAYYEAGVQLAYFWPDVGPNRLRLPSSVFDSAMSIEKTPEQMRLSLLANEDEIRAFSAAFSRVKEENERISAIFDRAIESLLAVIDHE